MNAYFRKGEELYRKGKKDGTSIAEANNIFCQALQSFIEAKKKSSSDKEVCLSLLNIGKTKCQIASLKAKALSEKNMDEVEILQKEFEKYSKECLDDLFESLKFARNKPTDLLPHVDSAIVVAFNSLVQFASSVPNFDRRVVMMLNLAKSMPQEELRSDLYIQITQWLKEHSSEALVQKEFQKGLDWANDMKRVLTDAEKESSSYDSLENIRKMRDRADRQLKLAESMITCTAAIKDLEALSSPSLDKVYVILDKFKDAALKAKGVDAGQEAIACYYQGHIFEKFEKKKDKAKTFYVLAMQLTEAAKPKLFIHEKWYMDLAASLRALQDEARARDEKAQEDIKKIFQKKLEKELNAISAAMNTGGPTELLRHVYSKHPPINRRAHINLEDLRKWGELSKKKKKKILRDAIADYHPDRYPRDKFGDRWHFLAQEITKSISSYHEIIKGLD